MRFSPLAVFVVIAFSMVALVPATALADDPDISGTYEYDEDQSDDMLEAFTPAIDEMSRLKRGFTRRRVRNQPPPPATTRIEQSDDEITINDAGRPPIEAPLDGTPVDYVNSDGENEKVTARIKNDAIEIHRDFEDGEYRTRYRLSSDGQRLGIFSEIDMDELPKVVHYRRIYNRK